MRVRVKAERVLNGEALGRFADAANAVSLNADDGISQEARKWPPRYSTTFAVRSRCRDDASFSDKLGFNEYLGTMLRELERVRNSDLLGISISQNDRRKLDGQNPVAAYDWLSDGCARPVKFWKKCLYPPSPIGLKDRPPAAPLPPAGEPDTIGRSGGRLQNGRPREFGPKSVATKPR